MGFLHFLNDQKRRKVLSERWPLFCKGNQWLVIVHAVSASLPMKVKYNPILERIKNSKDGSSFIIPFDANKLPMSFSKQFLGNGWHEGRKVLLPLLMDLKRVRQPFYSFINFPNKRGLRGLLLANTTLNFPQKQTHHDASSSSSRCLSKCNGFIWSSTEKFHFCNHWEKRWFSSGFSAAAALFCKHARNINNYGFYLSFANHYFCNERNRVIIGKNCEKWACNLMTQAFYLLIAKSWVQPAYYCTLKEGSSKMGVTLFRAGPNRSNEKWVRLIQKYLFPNRHWSWGECCLVVGKELNSELTLNKSSWKMLQQAENKNSISYLVCKRRP